MTRNINSLNYKGDPRMNEYQLSEEGQKRIEEITASIMSSVSLEVCGTVNAVSERVRREILKDCAFPKVMAKAERADIELLRDPSINRLDVLQRAAEILDEQGKMHIAKEVRSVRL